eukprot:4615449-Prymnesium_polylepis.1
MEPDESRARRGRSLRSALGRCGRRRRLGSALQHQPRQMLLAFHHQLQQHLAPASVVGRGDFRQNLQRNKDLFDVHSA